MYGDFSRITYDPENQHTRVLMQQGRPLLDADWNEQVEIQLHEHRTLVQRIVGQKGCFGNDFKVFFKEKNTAGEAEGGGGKGTLHCRRGHYYVGGIHCYGPTDMKLPQEEPKEWRQDDLANRAKAHVVTLTVHDRTLSLKEMKNVQEHALQCHPSTRMKSDWKIAVVPGKSKEHGEILPFKHRSPGLKFQLKDVSEEEIDNRLYRVEVHKTDKSTANEASETDVTLKWSRDIVTRTFEIEKIDEKKTIRLKEFPSSSPSALPAHKVKLVEFESDGALSGDDSALCEVKNFCAHTATLELKEKPSDVEPGMRVRLWEGKELHRIAKDDKFSWITIARGLSIGIEYSEDAKNLRRGDYWTIAVRKEMLDVESLVARAARPMLRVNLAELTWDGDRWNPHELRTAVTITRTQLGEPQDDARAGEPEEAAVATAEATPATPVPAPPEPPPAPAHPPAPEPTEEPGAPEGGATMGDGAARTGLLADLPCKHLRFQIKTFPIKQWLACAYLSEIVDLTVDQLRHKLMRSVAVGEEDREGFEDDLREVVEVANEVVARMRVGKGPPGQDALA
ncbi:DUF6519 domain-containing protein [Planctomycetota bacterium]